MSQRQEQMQERLRETAAEFLVRESNRLSLITVTAAQVDEKGQRATIFITVLPDSAETQALEFANRNKKEFGMYLLKKVRGMRIPHIEFVIDKGEKMRQRLDELS
ncbi:MAG TPA: ribosome-binding factor A [Candidatus Paceibacterota bacterium]|jgi:ribosome-binding factor A|nr:ribosome-binding factor A [Candidatus Paceibacterota bacterium]